MRGVRTVRRASALALGLVLLAGPAAPAAAQDRDLAHALDVLAALWARGDAAGFTEFTAATGTDLDLDGRSLGVVRGRKFTAALRRTFDGTETVSVVAGRTAPVAGAEDRAYGEIDWVYRRHGATRTDRNTVFFGLVREPRGWRVTQIRILR